MRMRAINSSDPRDPLETSQLVNYLGPMTSLSRPDSPCRLVHVTKQQAMHRSGNQEEEAALRDLIESVKVQSFKLCMRPDGGISRDYARGVIKDNGDIAFDHMLIAYRFHTEVLSEGRSLRGRESTPSYTRHYDICAFAIVDTHIDQSYTGLVKKHLDQELHDTIVKTRSKEQKEQVDSIRKMCNNAIFAHLSLICGSKGEGFGSPMISALEMLVRMNYPECSMIVLESVDSARDFYVKQGFVGASIPVVVPNAGGLMYKKLF